MRTESGAGVALFESTLALNNTVTYSDIDYGTKQVVYRFADDAFNFANCMTVERLRESQEQPGTLAPFLRPLRRRHLRPRPRYHLRLPRQHLWLWCWEVRRRLRPAITCYGDEARTRTAARRLRRSRRARAYQLVAGHAKPLANLLGFSSGIPAVPGDSDRIG